MKLAVRRPRPGAYTLREMGEVPTDPDLNLSYYSGHTSLVSGFCATAIYLAFARNDNVWEKWVTLVVGLGISATVGAERIASREHFPTDVMAGWLVGASIGVMVPHLHSVSDTSLRVAPTTDERTNLGLSLTGKL